MPVTHRFDSKRRDVLIAALSGPCACFPFANSIAANLAPVALDHQVMLAKLWDSSLNPAAYLVSEKLDGVRAIWDGSVLRFRSGRTIAAPPWFLQSLPATPLDGELWTGRHSFDRVSGVVRKNEPVDAEWRGVRYMVFDVPRDPEPFAQRAAHIRAVVATAQLPWLQAVEQESVNDAGGLQQRLKSVAAVGGEGLVLHRRDALWVPGRSDGLRKLKLVPDEEGTVLGYVPGTGKYQGKMGALQVLTPEGQQFALGTGFTDAMRADPPPIGARVTYRYRDRTVTGLPKFASFLRLHVPE